MINFKKLSTEDKLLSLHNSIQELMRALQGTQYGQIGIVEQVQNLQSENESLKKKVDDHIQTFKRKRNFERGVVATLLFLWALIQRYWDKLFSS